MNKRGAHPDPVQRRGTSQVARDQLAAALRDALDTIPAPARAVFVLMDIEYLTTQEVAATLGVSAASVRRRRAQALSILRTPSPVHNLAQYRADLAAYLHDVDLSALLGQPLGHGARHRCDQCDQPLGRRARSGRPPRYCSNACRQRAYRLRTEKPH
ncbi:RNA polymerase sigma factor [Nocardia pseudovaccinii]|uniref:RNA polymerase sigma factor n=1 Tax=Nocardia pseudovaccinii TaxID=189540 RepID=UPI0007A472A3|nr:sigma factor-like helix-turn-helix DNA-binding protein [Nocardia pseudovaccinii]